MFKGKYKALLFVSSIIGLGAWSCTDDLRLDEGKGNLTSDVVPGKLTAQIYFVGYEEGPKTRFTTDSTDRWSIGPDRVDNKTVSDVTFSDRDTVGIFARWGNMNLPTKDGRGGPLINVPMYFVKQEYLKDPNNPSAGTTIAYTLENDTVEVFPPAMKNGTGLFMYYPYSPEMGNITNYPYWREYVDGATYQTGSMYWDGPYTNYPDKSTNPNKIFPELPGLELRVKGPDGKPRCRDVVEMFSATTGDLTKGIISGAVYHGFSEIIVTRGQGFDKPVRKLDDGTTVEDETIYVVLDKPLSHLRVISYSDFVRWTTQLYYKENYSFDGVPMNEEEAKKWYAWEGAMYPYTANLPIDQRKRAWYAIVPSIYHQNNSASWQTNANQQYNNQYSARPTVSEICLYDNDGYLQHVTSFSLKTSDTGSPTKQPYPYYRWPIEIAMDELGPVVRPVTIENWEDEGKDKNITDERTAGIHNLEEYQHWASTYSTYINNNRQDDTGLSAYGDLIDNVWHFYVSGFDFNNQTLPYVAELQDIIEGNNQFFNVVWSNIRLAAPMFGKISGNGGFKNLDIQNPYLSYTGPADGDPLPVGILTNDITITDSSINSEWISFDNVNIYNATVISQNGAAGIMAGKINFARIANCEFSGKVIAQSTSESPAYLFGEDPVNQLNPINTSYSNIIYGAP